MNNPQDVMESRKQFDLEFAELKEQEVTLFVEYMNHNMSS